MIEMASRVLFILVVSMWAFYAVLMLYDVLFRPWRLVEEQIIGIERNIQTLKKGGRWAKLHSWLSMPAWRGDVERLKTKPGKACQDETLQD